MRVFTLFLVLITNISLYAKEMIKEGVVIDESIRLMRDWKTENGSLLNKGGWPLWTTSEIGKGDFKILIEASIDEKGKGTQFTLGSESRFSFNERNDKFKVSGPYFEKLKNSAKISDFISPGKPFSMLVARKGKKLSISFNSQEVYKGEIASGALGGFGFRPGGTKLRIKNMKFKGKVIAVPALKFVFECGENDYVSYRIPSLIRSKKGTLLAFAEGRKNGAGDSGNIDLVMKRSQDHGKTWSEMEVIRDIKQTAGNPCPIIDQKTGDIIMVFCEMDHHEHHVLEGKSIRRVFVMRSKDDGKTWSTPMNITEQANPNGQYNWLASGPGVGIQIRKGKYRGRLVIPMANSIGKEYGVHTIYSDDFGKTWKSSSDIKGGCNESQLVELSDGRLMLNMRMQGGFRGKRGLSYSKDGGQTWSEVEHDDELNCARCQASIIAKNYNGQRHYFFLNPATGGRNGLTLKVSTDDGETWPIHKLLYPLSASYSSLAITKNGRVACLFEGGTQHYSEAGIAIIHYPVKKLLSQKAKKK